MIKRAYFLVLLLSAAGCVGDWSHRESADITQESEAGAEPDSDADVILTDAGTPEASDPLDAASPHDSGALAEASQAQADATKTDADDSDVSAATSAEPAVRSAAIAVVDSPCGAALELACSGHNVAVKLLCTSGRWAFDRSCDGATRCDTRFGVTQGTCQAITPRCLGKQPGAAICDGNVRKSCGLDLLDELPNDCPAHSHCEGDGICACDRGYMKSEGGCIDIVDCPANACSNGQCVEATETYSCTCNSGFRPAPDGKSCVDIPDCTPTICGEAGSGTCKDGINDYSCTCAPGYEKKAGEKKCSNIDNCVGNPCGGPEQGTCRDGVNTYACTCMPGFFETALDGVHPTCFPVIDCGGCG